MGVGVLPGGRRMDSLGHAERVGKDAKWLERLSVKRGSNRATCDHQMKHWRVLSKVATAVRGNLDESGQREEVTIRAVAATPVCHVWQSPTPSRPRSF